MYEIPTSLCLEWKNLNYHVPSTEQSNYTFWQECRKVKELRLLKDGAYEFNTQANVICVCVRMCIQKNEKYI